MCRAVILVGLVLFAADGAAVAAQPTRAAAVRFTTTLSIPEWQTGGTLPGAADAEGVGRLDPGSGASQAVAAAVLEGDSLADLQSVGGRRLVGFLGGLLLGFFGPEALYQYPPFLVPALGGAAAVGLAAAAGAGRPGAAVMREFRGSDDAARRAFSDAYASRLRARRGRAALLAGGVGLGAGFVALATAIRWTCNRGDC